MNPNNFFVYITIASVSLFLVGWILIKRKGEGKNLSPLSTLAILFNITGIFLDKNETIGYYIISVGLALSLISIMRGKN